MFINIVENTIDIAKFLEKKVDFIGEVVESIGTRIYSLATSIDNGINWIKESTNLPCLI